LQRQARWERTQFDAFELIETVTKHRKKTSIQGKEKAITPSRGWKLASGVARWDRAGEREQHMIIYGNQNSGVGKLEKWVEVRKCVSEESPYEGNIGVQEGRGENRVLILPQLQGWRDM